MPARHRVSRLIVRMHVGEDSICTAARNGLRVSPAALSLRAPQFFVMAAKKAALRFFLGPLHAVTQNCAQRWLGCQGKGYAPSIADHRMGSQIVRRSPPHPLHFWVGRCWRNVFSSKVTQKLLGYLPLFSEHTVRSFGYSMEQCVASSF